MLDLTKRAPPIWVLIAVALILFVPALGLRDWWYPDEPDVALPVIEMAARGDWVVPSHNGAPWLDYPPLAYWGGLVMAHLQGEVTPFGTRLPMVAFFCILLTATVVIGRRLTNQSTAAIAGISLLAMPVLWFNATNLQVDLGFAAAQACGFALYLVGDAASGWRSWAWRAAAFAAFGIAILGKGPLGVLLPGLILTCWHAWNREWRRLLQLAPLALISVVVALPWYLFLIHRLGADFVFNELYLQNFDRFGNTNRGHGEKGAFYYFTNMPPDIGVWFLALLPALWVGFRARRGERNWRLLALWLLAPLAFFTLASTKRNVYMLPVYPAIALLAADWLMRADAGWQLAWRTWVARGFAWLLLLLGAVLLVAWALWSFIPLHRRATPELMLSLRPVAAGLGLWLVVAGGWCVREALQPQLRAWISLAAALALTWSAIMWLVLPAFDTVRTFRPAAHWIAERVPAQGAVGFHVPGREGSKRPAWLCHLGGRRVVFFSTPAAALTWLEGDSARLLISDPDRVPPIAGTTVVQSWMISGDTWTVLRADK